MPDSRVRQRADSLPAMAPYGERTRFGAATLRFRIFGDALSHLSISIVYYCKYDMTVTSTSTAPEIQVPENAFDMKE
jgi:hypothetical protein